MDRAPLYGLIMTGGMSRRMGRNKSLINYHGEPHATYLAGLLSKICSRVFISCRETDKSIWENYDVIVDSYSDIGPLAGLLSAFQSYPEAAFLTLACDYPYLTLSGVTELKVSRDHSKDVTAITGLRGQSIEPLLAIWEPSSIEELKKSFNQKEYSLMKILGNLRVKTIRPDHVEQFRQANYPEEANQAMDDLNDMLK